jgi:hypothetical protein
MAQRGSVSRHRSGDPDSADPCPRIRVRDDIQEQSSLSKSCLPPVFDLAAWAGAGACITAAGAGTYLVLFREIVLDVWKVRTAEAGALRAALAAKLADLRGREELLEEAFLYSKKIDATTYERQRDAIREQIALATLDLGDARHEEADVEGLLTFAEHILTNADRLWMEATIAQRARLQRALFPEGMRLRDGKTGTAVTCLAFTQLGGIEGHDSGVTSPTGFEPVFWP